MSKSPYRKNNYNNQRKDISPYKAEPSKLAQRSRLGHSYIAQQPTPQRRMAFEDTFGNQYTQKRGHGRLETVIQQNKYLLSQNNELSNLVNDRSKLIIALERKLQQQIAQEVHTLEEIESQKNRFMFQYSKKMQENKAKNECLMDEISQLNEDLYQLEYAKNKQIESIKERYTKQHKGQLQTILTNHAQTIELLQLEISKLKDVNHAKDQSIEAIQYETKNSVQKLCGQIEKLQHEIQHNKHVKKLQLSEQKINYENTIEKIKRQYKKQQQIFTLQYENELKRLKNQVNVRENEIQKLANDINTGKIQNQIKINELKERKSVLENQISELQEFQKTLINDEKERVKGFAELEISNVLNTSNQIIQTLKNQTERLVQLNNTKGDEVLKLYVQLQNIRNKHKDEIQFKDKVIDELKETITVEKQNDHEENQVFKSKMAHLRHSDITSLKNYYQNQIATLLVDIDTKEKIIGESREKMHNQIQDKTQMRKQFDIEVSKLNVRIGDLQLKLANAVTQKKQQLASFGSQMQLTSMTLLRASEQKQKYAVFSITEKRKLQKMIEDKDKQIEELVQKTSILNNNHNKEIQEKNQNIELLQKKVQDLETNLKKQKYFLENQVKRRESHHKNDKQFYESQIARIKRQGSENYNNLLQETNGQKQILQDEISRYRNIEKNLRIQLSMLKQEKEQQGLNNEITINQQKQRMTSMKDVMEINLTSYFKKEMESQKNEIKDLRQQIHEKNEDIRLHIQRQRKLQEKIEKLLQSQDKLREIEEKVINLGQQNNLVKNISELVKNRKR